MREVEVRLSRTVSAEEVERAVERSGHELGLRAGLARYPGSLHWHIKGDSERGTLESRSYRKLTVSGWRSMLDGGLAGLLRQ